MDCSICFNAIENNDNRMTTSCQHQFHYHCFRKWDENNSTCPLCRTIVSTKMCGLCNEPFKINNKDVIDSLDCNHSFHNKCLRVFLKNKSYYHKEYKCPDCNSIIDKLLGEDCDLHVAVLNDDLEMVRQLLENGCDPDILGRGGCTPMHYTKSISMLDLLISYKCNVNILNDCELSPFLLFTIDCKIDFVILLTERCFIDVNIKAVDGNTALHCAMTLNNVKIVQYLVEAGADCYAYNNDGILPFHITTSVDILHYFINECKIPINIKTTSGCTILHTQNENYELVKYVLQNGGNINARDNEKWTPVMALAYSNQDDDILELFIQYGADLNVRLDYNVNILHCAVLHEKCSFPFLSKLIRNGCDNLIKLRNDDGDTPLDIAPSPDVRRFLNSYHEFLNLTTTRMCFKSW